MFCALVYVGKHNVNVVSATQSFDTLVFRLHRLVGKIQIETLDRKTFSIFITKKKNKV